MPTITAPTRSLTRRTAHLFSVTAPSITGRGGQFLALTALAAMSAPQQYGRFVVLQTLLVGTASILGSTTSVAVNAATARIVDARSRAVLDLVPVMLRGRRRLFAAGAVVTAITTPIGYALVTGTTPPTHELATLAALGLLSGSMPVGDAVVAVVAGSGRYLSASFLDAARAVVGAGAALVGGLAAGPVCAGAGLVIADTAMVVVLVTAIAVRPPAMVERPTEHPREGMVAGILANITGQVTAWVLLFGIQVVGGPAALGLYGVANRFASVVTLAPVYFGKTVVGQLGDDAPAERRWSARSFLLILTGVSIVTAALSLGALVVVFPTLLEQYAGLAPVTTLLLAGTVARALLIGVGYVCVARRRWRTWVAADVASLAVTLAGSAVVWAAGGGVLAMVGVFGVGNLVGVAVRGVGSRRRGGVR